ncbi:hypothetical protein AVEN_231872-1 [Araneus ventricosus]|uniref:Uncharacterized protein n=1 Tax=Araneus ventricosus TaxID=182803 RepID=A0A4Y2LUG2_ARAVE|nr:hypothetical protein AVEN_231872-1 [Araneus ventricosus]
MFKGTNLRKIERICLDLVQTQCMERRNYTLKTFTISIQRLDKLLNQGNLVVKWNNNHLSSYNRVTQNVRHAYFQNFTNRLLIMRPVIFSSSAVPYADRMEIL